ncbi:ferredoxin [Micromonospora sp. CPCC 205539]|uniref:ferredoxin n=1 Tax=Micromonospora sp. CPCC 205539 TaxID=3122408 RepID=UPI002FF06193
MDDINSRHVVVDADRCVRSGLCVTLAPGVFDLGAGHAVTVLPHGEQVPAEHVTDVGKAIVLCPAEALRFAPDPVP